MSLPLCRPIFTPEIKTKRGFWQEGRYKERTRPDPGPILFVGEREWEWDVAGGSFIAPFILDASAQPSLIKVQYHLG